MSLELFSLAGKTALVTGGTHGIGMAIGAGLAKAGARLCVNDISAERLRTAREAYARQGVEVYTLEFDVTREAEVDRGCSQIERDVGAIDILVNNAGIIVAPRSWTCRPNKSGRSWRSTWWPRSWSRSGSCRG